MDSNHTCLVVISLDSALKKDDSYYLQVFPKECKYIDKKVIRHSNDNLIDIFSHDDESDEDQLNRLGYFLQNAWYIFITFQNTIFGCIELFYELYPMGHKQIKGKKSSKIFSVTYLPLQINTLLQ